MTRVLTDGFELGDYGRITGYTGTTTSSAQALGGTFSHKVDGSTDTFYYTVAPVSSGFVKFSFRLEDSSPTYGGMLALANGTAAADNHLSLYRSPSTGLLSLRRYTTSIATGSLVIQPFTWYNVETFFFIDDTSGSAVVKINGATDIDFVGDTKYASSGVVTNVRFGYSVISSSYAMYDSYYDNIMMNDLSGAEDNSWLGDRRIALLKPTGNGDNTSLSGSDGNLTDNYTLVDDVPSDGDTTYVYSSTTGAYDLYATSGSIPALSEAVFHAVTPVGRARCDILDGTGNCKLGVKTGGAEFWETSDNSLGVSYSTIEGERYAENPATSAAWSYSDIEALQVGFKIT